MWAVKGKVTEDRDSGKVCQGGQWGVIACSGIGHNTAPGNLGVGGCEENLFSSKRIGPLLLSRVKQKNSSTQKTDGNR